MYFLQLFEVSLLRQGYGSPSKKKKDKVTAGLYDPFKFTLSSPNLLARLFNILKFDFNIVLVYV